MPFATVCFWAFSARASFWASFEKFPLVPLCTFSENAGFGRPCQNCHNLVVRELVEALFCPKIFFSLGPLSAYYLEDNAICASVLLGVSNEVYFLEDFWKIFLGPPRFFFLENAGFEWLRENCHNLAIRELLEPLFKPKCSPVFAP